MTTLNACVRHAALRSAALTAGAAIALLALAGCNRQTAHDSSQVAAEVGGVELTVHQIQALLRRNPQAASQLGERATAQALRELIEQELAAQAAHAEKLDLSPNVIQTLEVVRREALARAYLDTKVPQVITVDPRDVRQYVAEHAQAFDAHRQFIFEEVVIAEPPERVAALRTALAPLDGWASIRGALQTQGVRFQSRTAVLSSIQVADDLRQQLASLQNGKFLLREGPQASRLIVMRENLSVPLTESDKLALAREMLTARQKSAALEAAMDALKRQTKVTYRPGYTAAQALVEGRDASGAASAPAGSASAAAAAAAASSASASASAAAAR